MSDDQALLPGSDVERTEEVTSLMLGFLESFTEGYISTKWSDLIVFTVLIAFMIFRPQGLLGRADIRKV